MFNSYAAGVVKQPELASVRSSGRMKVAKQVEPLRQMDPMSLGNRVCLAVSLSYVPDNCDAPLGGYSAWLGFLVKRAARLVSRVSGWGAAS